MGPTKLPIAARYSAIVAFVAFGATGCGATGGATSADNFTRAAVGEADGAGIRQRVTVAPMVVRQGDTVTVRSTLRVRGTGTMLVHNRVCGLDYRGTLRLGESSIRCLAYSARSRLAPGDSIVAIDRRPVQSGPGRWQLRVQHALDIGLEAAVDIEVVAP